MATQKDKAVDAHGAPSGDLLEGLAEDDLATFRARVSEALAALDRRTAELETPQVLRAASGAVEAVALTDRERVELGRAYTALRTAEDADAAEQARERIRGFLGEDAEIGDHVLMLADGTQVRTEYAGSTSHNGVPVVSAYESAQ